MTGKTVFGVKKNTLLQATQFSLDTEKEFLGKSPDNK